MSAEPVVLIPAYQPGKGLIALVQALRTHGLQVCIVNDGSDAATQAIFDECRRLGADVQNHTRNRGKGAALKTGLQYLRQRSPELRGVITADADGQHTYADVQAVVAAFQASPNSLVLGSRDLQAAHVPALSRWGNHFSRRAFRIATGRDLPDTQTGLRGLPSSLIAEAMQLPQRGYDWELAVLFLAVRRKTDIRTPTISTTYIDANASSHFKPARDTVRIARVLLSFFRR